MDQYNFNINIKSEQLNNALSNLRFCIMINDASKKSKIIEMIKEMSGSVIANPVKNQLDYIIADRLDFRVKAAVNNTNVIALKPEFIESCHNMSNRVYMSSFYVLSASEVQI